MILQAPFRRPTHPGEFIRADILEKFGLTQESLAQRLGVSRRSVNQLVNGKRSITADMAWRLGQLTRTSPQLWLNLQAAVDLWDAKNRAIPLETIEPITPLPEKQLI